MTEELDRCRTYALNSRIFYPTKKDQSPIDIDPKVVQYRARKGFGITFDANSTTYK